MVGTDFRACLRGDTGYFPQESEVVPQARVSDSPLHERPRECAEGRKRVLSQPHGYDRTSKPQDIVRC